MRVPGNGVADPAKAIGASGTQRLQHRLDAVAELQISMTDNRRGGLGGTVEAGRARRRETLDKLDLADRAQFGRAVRPVHRARLDKHGRADIVAGVDVGGEFVHQIALIGDALQAPVPEMMMRVADRDLRLQHLLAGEGKPVVSAVGHRAPPFFCSCSA